jgi:hypothetical protein
MSLRKFHTPLTEAEVEEIYQLLTPKVASIYEYFYKAEQKKQVVRSFSVKKGIIVAEDMDTKRLEKEVNDLVLVDILDGGYGKRSFRYECGIAPSVSVHCDS